MLRRGTAALAAAVVLLSAATTVIAPAAVTAATAAPVASSGQLVDDFPKLGTPHAMDGAVYDITQVGDTIVAVGSFSRVSPAATFHETQDDLIRRGIFAFDADTGVIDRSFDVSLRGGRATSIETDGSHLYVGGDFTSVDGSTTYRRLVKLAPSGRVVAGFRATAPAEVQTLAVQGGRVFVGGSFATITGGGHTATRRGLAALDADDGAVLPSVQVPFTGVYTRGWGSTAVKSIDISDDGTRLVAVGNFARVGGRNRVQVAVLDIGSGQARVTGWHTNRFDSRHNRCNRRFGSFVRHVAFAPGGSWFVVATTGGFGGGVRAGTLCDTTSRWPTRSASRGPTWVDYTGGDTTTGVEIARGVVYVGGHMRWQNNPFRGGRRGPGAVAREGLAALDPVTGLPLSWNPGRVRGVGVQAFLVTDDGLWVGSDSTLLANQRRGRIALLPWDGGHPIPLVARATLPNDLFLAPQGWAGLRQRPVDGRGAPVGATEQVATGMSWSRVRGAFYANGNVYYGWSRFGLFRRAFDPDTGALGPRYRVGLRGLALSTSRLTGMFYEPLRHRLYYTLAGDPRLLFRDFSIESNVIGAVGHVAPRRGVSFARVAGMTLAGNRILYGSTDGRLRSVVFRGGGVVSNAHVLSSDRTWRTSALFVPND